jgi:S-DNA-T family DNA segregation ATPase FtsK/SpoIIIE
MHEVSEWDADAAPLPVIRRHWITTVDGWAWKRRRWAHMARYHAHSSPTYAGRATKRFFVGTGRGLRTWWLWISDAETRELRRHAAATRDIKARNELLQDLRETVRRRMLATGALAAILAAGGTAEWFLQPTWLEWELAVATTIAAPAAVWRGAPEDGAPLIDQPYIADPAARDLTPDMLTSAFIAAKLCTEDNPIGLHPPGVYRDGEGFSAIVELPLGTTATQALAKAEQLAGGLGATRHRLFLDRVSGDEGSEQQVRVWLADRDPYATKPPLTPLADMEMLDFWDGFAFGVDERGREITLSLIWTSLLISSIPRMGKTFAARLVLAAAALDPYVRLIIHNGKGGRDYKVFQPVCHWYGSGSRDDTIADLHQTLRQVQADMEATYDALEQLSDEECPEEKLTRELCRTRPGQFHLSVIAMDEFHIPLAHPTFGPLIAEILIDLVKRGPAAGVILVLATQKVDSDAVPTALRDQIGLRLALKLMTSEAARMALGPGCDLDPTKLRRAHKGVGILRGTDDESALEEVDAIRARTYLTTAQVLTSIIDRAHLARQRAGTLTGHASGQPAGPATAGGTATATEADVVRDVLAILEAGQEEITTAAALELLKLTHPTVYAQMSVQALGQELSRAGVKSIQMPTTDPATGRRSNPRGVTRQALLDAPTAGRRSR